MTSSPPPTKVSTLPPTAQWPWTLTLKSDNTQPDGVTDNRFYGVITRPSTGANAYMLPLYENDVPGSGSARRARVGEWRPSVPPAAATIAIFRRASGELPDRYVLVEDIPQWAAHQVVTIESSTALNVETLSRNAASAHMPGPGRGRGRGRGRSSDVGRGGRGQSGRTMGRTGGGGATSASLGAPTVPTGPAIPITDHNLEYRTYNYDHRLTVTEGGETKAYPLRARANTKIARTISKEDLTNPDKWVALYGGISSEGPFYLIRKPGAKSKPSKSGRTSSAGCPPALQQTPPPPPQSLRPSRPLPSGQKPLPQSGLGLPVPLQGQVPPSASMRDARNSPRRTPPKQGTPLAAQARSSQSPTPKK